MAVYTNLAATAAGQHGIVELSNLKSTIVGNIYDVIVQGTVSGETANIACDNGVLVKVGARTGEGLQTKYATIAAVGDKVALISTPATIKDAFTKAQAQEYNFTNEAGKVSRAHEVVAEDVFGIADYQITSGTAAKDAYVVVDGNGGYEVKTSAPDAATYGFIGQIIDIATGLYASLVRIEVLQNVDIVEAEDTEDDND